MSIKNRLEEDLIECGPHDTIEHAASLMREKNVGAIVITEQEKPIGIVTDRDIALHCVADSTAIDSSVSQVMSKGVLTVNLENGIFDVVKAMKHHLIRRVPVVDSDGKCVGLLSLGDVYQLGEKELSHLLAPLTLESNKIAERAA